MDISFKTGQNSEDHFLRLPLNLPSDEKFNPDTKYRYSAGWLC